MLTYVTYTKKIADKEEGDYKNAMSELYGTVDPRNGIYKGNSASRTHMINRMEICGEGKRRNVNRGVGHNLHTIRQIRGARRSDTMSW